MSKNDPTPEEIAAAAAAEAEAAGAGDAAAAAAAEGAATDPVEPALNGPGQTSIRVLRKGAGKVFTGEQGQDEDGHIVFLTYEPGTTVHGVPIRTALELEDRGFVEVVDGD